MDNLAILTFGPPPTRGCCFSFSFSAVKRCHDHSKSYKGKHCHHPSHPNQHLTSLFSLEVKIAIKAVPSMEKSQKLDNIQF